MTGILFAVHIADGVLPLPWLVGGFAIASLPVARSLWRIPADDVPRIGVLTAAFFVASQIHLPVGVGSVHLLLNGLVGVLLRRYAPLAIAEGLLLQALLFGHGGLFALGVNACVLTLPAVVAGWSYAHLPGRPALRGVSIGAGACTLTVLLNAAVLALGGGEGWYVLVGTLMLLHLPVILVEALGTGVVVGYLARVRPEWLSSGNTSANGTSH